jgi:hypothetical protein
MITLTSYPAYIGAGNKSVIVILLDPTVQTSLVVPLKHS